MKKVIGSVFVAVFPLLFALALVILPSTTFATVENNGWHHFFHWQNAKGTLVVIKKTLGGNGTFDMYGGEGIGAFSIRTHFHFGSKTLRHIEPGTYTVDESAQDGWEEVSNTCEDVVVRAHRTSICVIVNQKSDEGGDEDTNTQTGGLVVIKNTTGGDGPFSFTGSAGNFNITTAEGSGQQSFPNIPVGTYSVTEVSAEGWHVTGSDCDAAVVTADATTTCTISNERIVETGNIAVIKNTVGGDATFSFTGISAFDITTIAGSGEQDIYSVPVGTFSLAETPITGWTLTSSNCDSTVIAVNATTTCTFVNTKNPVIETVSGGSGNNQPSASGGGGGNGPIAGSLTSIIGGGSVLGASTTASSGDLPAGCSALLSGYMRMGKRNDSEQVKKLQQFLNEEMKANLTVTGFFGNQTDGAVREFQKKHSAQVLSPWGINDSTGYVYKTTQRWINMRHCAGLDIPMPDLR